MERRNFLKGVIALPFAGKMLRGMDWAAMAPEEAAAAGQGGYSCVVPAGTILPFAGQEPPPGFLPCDGRAVPRFAYRKLYGAIGAAYGVAGPRGMSFRVPDLRASARPAAALAADERSAAMGQVPAYLSWGYVIRT